MEFKSNLTQDELKEHLIYNPETGIFTRLKSISTKIKVGDVAGSQRVNKYGYKDLQIMVLHKLYKAHRLAWLYMTGKFPHGEIDHINGNGLDNRFVNLRDVSRTENQRNKRKAANNKSGITGVCWVSRDNVWSTHIGVNGKSVNVGYFTNLFDAACARKRAEIIHGYHENHGSSRAA